MKISGKVESLKLVVLTVLLGCFFSVSNAAEKPNIVFILTDDQGYGDIGRHGHPLLKTPNMDKLFDESVRFDNFYVSPSCSPTRAALLTGMHELRNGVSHTIKNRTNLNLEATLLPQLLKKAGYRTGIIGKWHLGETGDYAAQNRGFDVWIKNPGNNNEFSMHAFRNGEKREAFREDIYFDEAMTFMEESGDQPFFCFLSTYAPHTPLAAPERNIKPYRDAVDEETATFLGEVDNIDENLGHLLEFLSESKLEENTIVIFMNDNGETKGLDVYNAGMRGCKCTIWHGGSRAMSFWRWPNHWKPHTDMHLTAHLDVLPTLCELAGATLPADLQPKLDGYSLLPMLESTTPPIWHEDRILFQHVARWPAGQAASHKYAQCAVRQGNYLLLRSRPCDNPDCTPEVRGNQCHTLRLVEAGQTRAVYTESNAQFHWGVSPADHWSLFDVKQDPACELDLWNQDPQRVEAMTAAYDSWWDAIYPEMVKTGSE